MNLSTSDYWLGVYGPSIVGLLLCVTAGAHRMMLGTSGYVTSWLIPVEFGLLALLLLICAGQPLLALYLIARKRWKRLLLVALTLLICAVCIMSALLIDSPTLIYAT